MPSPSKIRAHGTGSLFDAVPSEVLTVSRLAGNLRSAIESRFSNLRVEGEISNFKRHTSGHCYFTLKDERAQLRAVMWRSNASRVFFQPTDGMLVQVLADVSIYENRGELQLVVRSMQPAGEGGLQKAFEVLKATLAAEGLFDRARKRRLPAFPAVIGVVTSGSGAALHDVLSVLERRFPYVRVVLCSVQVQGMGAAESICAAIKRFNGLDDGHELRPDLLIVGRGGGSMEDLWAFNEEIVARSIFSSRIPIISAVGHETDFSIADFVADVRAATPSMAAELAVPDRHELLASVLGAVTSMQRGLHRRFERHRNHLKHVMSSYGFLRPIDRLLRYEEQIEDFSDRLRRMASRCIDVKRRRLKAASDRLRALSPERPLQHGYALVERDDEIIRRAQHLEAGDEVRLRFYDGRRGAIVTED